MQEKASPSTGAGGTPAKVKTDSWMEDSSIGRSLSSLTTGASGHGKNGRKFSNILEMERFSSNNIISMDDSSSTAIDYNPIDDIPVLPDADEIHESLLYNESPNLPSATTYKNLSSDIFTNGKASALGNLDEIDISILTECLESEQDIEEPDEVWTWDQLFTQLSVKINTETKTPVAEYSN
ncbi:intraflagellar transport protein 43 homolog [Anopheles ziemanni]|uniref:intraflagellar transport protein 43 homolog n=1 Tax=Anopheles coustani TaxID=139045 RepID=UPI002658840A|nr:intraflagellar transport protein 43 homolog [Anopheles coustani]XP_058169265.1 intraflagellar transport protein 43 homolog [Anopheles ziemanni]